MPYFLQLSQKGGTLPQALDAQSDLVARPLGHSLGFQLIFGQRQHLLVAKQRKQVRVLVQTQTLEPRRNVCNGNC